MSLHFLGARLAEPEAGAASPRPPRARPRGPPDSRRSGPPRRGGFTDTTAVYTHTICLKTTPWSCWPAVAADFDVSRAYRVDVKQAQAARDDHLVPVHHAALLPHDRGAKAVAVQHAADAREAAVRVVDLDHGAPDPCPAPRRDPVQDAALIALDVHLEEVDALESVLPEEVGEGVGREGHAASKGFAGPQAAPRAARRAAAFAAAAHVGWRWTLRAHLGSSGGLPVYHSPHAAAKAGRRRTSRRDFSPAAHTLTVPAPAQRRVPVRSRAGQTV